MGEKKKITITLPIESIEILEQKSKQLNMSKSDYINRLITSATKAGRKEKLTQCDKEHIKNLYVLGVPVTKLALQYKCSRNLIYKIVDEIINEN